MQVASLHAENSVGEVIKANLSFVTETGPSDENNIPSWSDQFDYGSMMVNIMPDRQETKDLDVQDEHRLEDWYEITVNCDFYTISDWIEPELEEAIVSRASST